MSNVAQLNRASENEKWLKAHKAGIKYKKMGFERISPYIDATRTYFYTCGFDGIKFEQAVETLQQEMQQVKQKELV